MTRSALRHLSLTLIAAALLGGCAAPALSPVPVTQAGDADSVALARMMTSKSVVLMGEVHDNAAGHQRRLQALRQAVSPGWRPAIAMEQFDRENQPLLDRAMASCADADCVIALASPGKNAWNWDLYKPVIELALRERLPLLGANLSRADASRVVRDGLGSVFYSIELRDLNLDFGPPPALLRAQETEVADGHCGMLPTAMHAGMATAQIARDAMMALVLAGVKDRPAVLLAGNGHVRRDLGVAQWLGQRSVLAIGYLEQAPAAGLYDLYETVPAATRPDPCEAFRAQAAAMKAAAPKQATPAPATPAAPPPAAPDRTPDPDDTRAPFGRLTR